MTTHTVEFIGLGERLEIAETETILSRCLDEGLVSEYSCRVGMCLACCAEIIEGSVVQPAARGLTDEESETFALTCMSRPASDLKLQLNVYPPSIESEPIRDPLAGAPTDW